MTKGTRLPPPTHLEDLALARAWAEGDTQALEYFQSHFRPLLQQQLVKKGFSAAVADEALQHLTEKLFVSQGDKKKRILDYTGKGPLEAWLRTSAMRDALNVIRSQGMDEPSDNSTLAELASNSNTPELDYVRANYRDDFKLAFRFALGSLDTRDRTLLKLSVLDGLTHSRIARAYNVDRTTVIRWLAAAREQLLQKTQEHLAQHTGAKTEDIRSIVGDLKSAVEVSLIRHLKGE